jgi:hypothetical protein
MKKNSTAATSWKQIFREKKLTIEMDLGDQSTYYCVLDEAGEVIVEQKLPTTNQGIKQVFGRIPRSRVALETGAHSPITDLSDVLHTKDRASNSPKLRETGRSQWVDATLTQSLRARVNEAKFAQGR